MRNAKKLLLLLLSIALLCGIFIVTALAEDGEASAEPATDYVSIVSNTLQPITTLKEGETIIHSKVITKLEDADPVELVYMDSENILYDTSSFVLLNASNGIERYIEPGETVTSELFGRRIAILPSGRLDAILWESDGEHYNHLVWEGSTKNESELKPGELIRKIFTGDETYNMSGRKLTLYNNVSYNSDASNLLKGVAGTNSYVDLNGYTLTITNSKLALKLSAGTLYLYSSQPGGKIVADAPTFFVSAGDATPSYFGEDADDATDYAANFTVEAPSFSQLSYKINILGGTYVQPEGATADYFLSQVGSSIVVKNATFIIKGTINKGFWRSYTGTITTSQDAPVTVICEAEEPINLAFHANNGEGAVKTTFNAWYFYNVIPNVETNVSYSYSGCRFNTSYANPLASGIGRIAFDGNFETKTVAGKEYTFGATMVAVGQTALVQWGFDIPAEYWMIDAQASHADVVVDGLFAYGFAPFTVKVDTSATPILKAVKPETIFMSLTLQSQISMNLSFSEALDGATITVGGTPLEEGKRTYTYAVAPNVANENVNVIIVIGENTHTVPVNVGSYASAVLASTDETYDSVRCLTYAMVEYVRAMTGVADFLEGVSVPTGYVTKTPGEAAYEKDENNTLLTGLRFNLSGTIALEIEGADAKEMEVTLRLANGRTEVATVDANGSAIFEGLYVNEFCGTLTLTVGGETYTYSIENYYNAMTAADKPAVAALYNYVWYANDYVVNS